MRNFAPALGIHRVPYGSIGKHNGQRWTPGVREHCTVTDCPGVVPPWCWLCLCISAHFWSSLSVCQSIFDEDIDWGGAECVCSSLEMPRSWCLSCQGWDHQPPVLPGSDWDEDVERRPVAADCVVSPVRALPGDWWSPGWSCSPSSREAAVRLLCWCSTPARAGLLWLIALTSHCRQLSSPRPSQQNQ